MQDFKLLTRQLLETYLGSDTLGEVAIQDFLASNASIIGTGKQEFFKNIEHFLNSFKFDVEKRKNIHFEFKNLEIEENIVDDQCVFVYGSVQIYGLYDKEVTIIHLDTRFTIIYGVRDGKWKVLHIHHSIPDKEQLEDEEFPIALGKQVQQARHEVEVLSAGYSYICLINLETGDVELIKGNNIPGLNGRYTQTDHNILLEQVNRLIAKPFRQSSVEFYDSKTIAKRLVGKNSLFHTCERTDGTWILSMIVPQKYDENGRVVSVLLANRDFTEEKKRELEQEEALRQEKIKAEKANEAKSIFLFNMSHDIRTPMNAIVGYSQLMKKELTNPKLIHYQEMIEQSSKLLLSIINNVLDMARVESGKMELDENYEVIGNISQLVCSAFAAEASRKNIELNIVVNVENKHIIVDSTKMQEILSNLISNAIKYTSAGGYISSCLTLMDRERQKIKIKGAILDYPPLRQEVDTELRKVADPSKAISENRMLQYINWYYNNFDELDDILASPLLADLHDLPKTLVISAEYDALKNEEKAYADKMREAGGDVEYYEFKNCRHGFTHECFNEYMPKESCEAWNLMSDFIKKVMA